MVQLGARRAPIGRMCQYILLYIESTPIDIKLNLPWQIFEQNQQNSNPKSPHRVGEKHLTLLSL